MEMVDEEALTSYIQTKGCRRAVLAEHLDDGIPLSCRESTEEVVYCDYCEETVMPEGSLRRGYVVEDHAAAVGRRKL